MFKLSKEGDIIIYPNEEQAIYPEHWVPLNRNVEMFKNTKLQYLVSSYGRVYNQETNTYLPQDINYNKDKYINIVLSTIDGGRYQAMLHRIVMYAFNYIPGCENFDVNHIDGIKYHNWVWNLEWTTHKQNMNHAWDNNLFKFGKERKNTKLTEEQVREICQMIDDGIPLTEIKKKYKVDGVNMNKTIYNIANGHCWSHISKDYKFGSLNKEKSSTTNERKIICPIRFR